MSAAGGGFQHMLTMADKGGLKLDFVWKLDFRQAKIWWIKKLNYINLCVAQMEYQFHLSTAIELDWRHCTNPAVNLISIIHVSLRSWNTNFKVFQISTTSWSAKSWGSGNLNITLCCFMQPDVTLFHGQQVVIICSRLTLAKMRQNIQMKSKSTGWSEDPRNFVLAPDSN